jgi:hypothetical protein
MSFLYIYPLISLHEGVAAISFFSLARTQMQFYQIQNIPTLFPPLPAVFLDIFL